MEASHLIIAGFGLCVGYWSQPAVKERPCNCHCNCSTSDSQSAAPSGYILVGFACLLCLLSGALLGGSSWLYLSSTAGRGVVTGPKGKYGKGTLGTKAGLQILDG